MINQSAIWKKLQDHFKQVSDLKLRDLFAADAKRFRKFSLEREGLFLDYSKNRITDVTFGLLMELAREAEIEAWRERLFRGDKVNLSEAKPALHAALRDDGHGPAAAAGKSDEAASDRARMYELCEEVRAGRRTGFSGKPFRTVVNVGTGGSHLGPATACRALAHLGRDDLSVSFVTGADERRIAEVLSRADPEQTLFVVTSKTFATRETLTGAERARDWIVGHYGAGDAWPAHCLAVTANVEAALRFGVPRANVLTIRDEVGGRFSLWSSVGFPLAALAGSERFDELLAGARNMDAHFAEAPLESNIPVILALLDVWYVNFHGAGSRAVLPYDYALERLPEYLQQLEMESNGKSVDRDGRVLEYATAPVVWGKAGIEGQHAFYQLLHQSKRLVPCDFIVTAKNAGSPGNHGFLHANFLAQSRALMYGDDAGDPHRRHPGNQPSNALVLDALSPFTLGLLLALYEHKVFAQAVIWGINPFDQWGVELGKRIAAELPLGRGDELDGSTRGLMKRLGFG